MAVRNYDDLVEAYHSDTGLDELRLESLRLMVGAAAVGAFVLGLASLPAPLPELIHAWAIVAILVLTAALTDNAVAVGLRVGALIMIAGLLSVETAALYFYRDTPISGGFALVALAACALLGWRWGAATGAAGSGIVAATLWMSQGTISPTAAAVTVLLIWGGVVLAWLLSRPTQIALDWSWHSYVQALQKTEDLRDRQAELGRLSKSLTETCERLEQLNQELERARQAAEEARQLKSEFASTISHELRSPLNLVIGFSEMLIRHLGAGAQTVISREELETIYRNASHISTMIDDILDLAQIEAHRMALQRERVSLSEIVAEATATVGSLLSRLGLELKVDLPPDLPVIFVDRTRVRQILINLLGNAVRFTEEGRITISARQVDGDIVVSVTDTGVGIRPEDVPRLFQDFSRVERAGASRGRSGLGLAVSKRFAELHGGSMWVESEPGEGSTFLFSLPLREHVVSIPHEQDWERLIGGVKALDRTVVVVDQGQQGARIFQRYLDGCRVLAARDAGEAERLSRGQPIHALVVVDSAAQDGHLRLQGTVGEVPVFECPLRTLAEGPDLGVAERLVKPVTHWHVKEALRRLGRGVHDVLIVDDDPEMVELLKEMVKAAARHYRVRTAQDGESALAMLRQQRTDAVLLDLLMPGMDGYQVLEAMRSDGELREIPVVVVTARGQQSELVRATRLSVSRLGGLGVGEAVRCIKASLDVLATPVGHSDNAQAQPAALLG